VKGSSGRFESGTRTMGDDLQRQALARNIAIRLQACSVDELRVQDRVLGRLELGRQRYGDLDLSRPRDWRRERFEERLDALVYDVCDELVLEDATRAELREAARREMLGDGPSAAVIEFDAGDRTRSSSVPAQLAGADPRDSYDELEIAETGGEG